MIDSRIENVIVGSMLNDKICLGVGLQLIATEEAFKSLSNRVIYKALMEMTMRSEIVDIFTVQRWLKNSGKFNEVGDKHWEEVILEGTDFPQFEKHVEIFNDAYRLRMLINVAAAANQKAKEGFGNSQELISSAIMELEGIMRTDRSVSVISAGKVLNEIKDDIFELSSGRRKQLGHYCGFEKLGEEFSYLPGDLIIIGARPAMGKSAWMIQLAKNLAIDQKIPTGLISLEMRAKENIYRLMANIMSVDSRAIEKGFYDHSTRERFFNISNQYAAAPLFINETYDIDHIALRANIMTMVKTYGCKVIFIDHLGLINISKLMKEYKSENSAIGQITRMLKIIATELEISIVALHQLSRSVEERKPPRPMLSDLRSSGNIEQDANKVLFLYRPDYYAQPGVMATDAYNRDLTGITEVSIAKNRNGNTGAFYFETDKKTSCYKESHEFNETRPNTTTKSR